MVRFNLNLLIGITLITLLSTGLQTGTSAAADKGEISPPPKAMKLPAKRKAVIISTYEHHIAETPPLRIGDPEGDAIVRMGQPEGIMTIGNKKRLSYGEGHVVVSGGKIISITNISKERLSSPDLDSYNDYQEAKGKVFYMGKWMTEVEAYKIYDKTVAARELATERVQRGKIEVARTTKQYAMANAQVADFRQGGKRISKQELVVPGKVTIVDFYADWCGPCKAAAPYLEAMAKDPDVVLRKVDIVNWRTAVTKQWNIRSIPNMRVYDRHGREVGKPTASLKEIYDNIQKAK